MNWRRYKYAFDLFIAFSPIVRWPQAGCGQRLGSRWITPAFHPGGVELRLPIYTKIGPETLNTYGRVDFEGAWPLWSDARHMLRNTDIVTQKYENAYGHSLLLDDGGELYLLLPLYLIEDAAIRDNWNRLEEGRMPAAPCWTVLRWLCRNCGTCSWTSTTAPTTTPPKRAVGIFWPNKRAYPAPSACPSSGRRLGRI